MGCQRYKCLSCGKQFQSKRRKVKLQNKLWKEYVHGKQTAEQLGDKYGKSRKWVLKQLREVKIDSRQTSNFNSKSVVVVADATFFSRSYGILIFREPNTKKNLVWKEIYSETPGQYQQLKVELECMGFNIEAVILDGKRGVRNVFAGIPTQMCQFHQVATVSRYLTRRPILEAGKELRKIALQLTSLTEKELVKLLNEWELKWKDFLKEKTVNPITDKWCYTHKRIRSAHRSLKTNLPYLFTYQKYPELNIPNTCNSLDGYNTTLKTLAQLHRGINTENRYKMICQILKK